MTDESHINRLGIFALAGVMVFFVAGIFYWCKGAYFAVRGLFAPAYRERLLKPGLQFVGCVIGAMLFGTIGNLWGGFDTSSAAPHTSHDLPSVKECSAADKNCNPYDTPENRAIFARKKAPPVPVRTGELQDGKAAFDRQDYQTALKILRPLADHGNAEAQFNIGQMYEYGYGVKQNDEEVEKWLRKAADNGDAHAKFELKAIAHVRQRPGPPWFDRTKCPKEKAWEAIKADDPLKSWDAVYNWFQKFKVCDYHSGEIGESLDDAVAVLLANDWKDLPRLLELSRQDTDFRKFVLSYIGETAAYDDLKTAKKNARTDCPPDAADLCAEIIKGVDDLGKEDQPFAAPAAGQKQ